MTFSSQVSTQSVEPMHLSQTEEVRQRAPLLSPPSAWRILRRRTGGHVSRSTFYRWLGSGKVYTVRFGSRLYVPWQALQDLISRCLDGTPL